MPMLNLIVLIYGVFPIILFIVYLELLLNPNLWSLGKSQLPYYILAKCAF